MYKRKLCLDFTVREESLGETKVIDLVENGADVDLTNDNLKQFMELSLKCVASERVYVPLRTKSRSERRKRGAKQRGNDNDRR